MAGLEINMSETKHELQIKTLPATEDYPETTIVACVNHDEAVMRETCRCGDPDIDHRWGSGHDGDCRKCECEDFLAITEERL